MSIESRSYEPINDVLEEAVGQRHPYEEEEATGESAEEPQDAGVAEDSGRNRVIVITI